MQIEKIVPILAPVVLEEKIGATITLRHCQEEELKSLLVQTGVDLCPLYKGECGYVYLVYRREALYDYLCQHRQYLAEDGYAFEHLEEALWRLQHRMELAISKKENFPHELGYFLGFPKEDICAYKKQGGKASLYTGYWQVYVNLEEAKRIFCRYDMAREYVCRLIRQGLSLAQIKHQFIYGGRNYYGSN